MIEKKYYFNRSEMLHIRAIQSLDQWDRNEIVTPNTSIKLLRNIGQIKNNLNFYDICMSRAQQIVKIAKEKNKKIYLFWSGGLDSTGVFLCLRELVQPEELGILYTQTSKEEYPGFFENNIDGIYETYEFFMNCTWMAMDYAIRKGIAVTGEIGDQLFGSVMFKDRPPEEMMKHWSSFDNKLTGLEVIQKLVDACPQKVNSCADFFWWLNYSMKYQTVQVRMLLDNKKSILDDNVFHFYDSDEFNDYAVSTPMEEKIPDYSMKKYKMPLREVIYKLSKDAEYSYNKPKVLSLNPVYGNISKHIMANSIDLNWNRLY